MLLDKLLRYIQTQTWIQIVNGEMQPVMAMVSGKLKIDGGTELIQQFQQYFST
jgi:putative sterol carrier protein